MGALSPNPRAEAPAGSEARHTPARAAAAVVGLLGADPGALLVADASFDGTWLRAQRVLGPLNRGAFSPAAAARILHVARAVLDRVAPTDGSASRSPLAALVEVGALRSIDPAAYRCLVRALGVTPAGAVVELEGGVGRRPRPGRGGRSARPAAPAPAHRRVRARLRGAGGDRSRSSCVRRLPHREAGQSRGGVRLRRGGVPGWGVIGGPRIVISRKNVDDIYPLSPLAAGHPLPRALGVGAGRLLRPARLDHRRARSTCAPSSAPSRRSSTRHPRCAPPFVWDGRDRPLQVVRERAALPFTERDRSARPRRERAGAGASSASPRTIAGPASTSRRRAL